MESDLQQLHKPHKLVASCDPDQDYSARQLIGEIVERMKASTEREEKLVAGTEQIVFDLLGALKKMSLYPPLRRLRGGWQKVYTNKLPQAENRIKHVEKENKTLHEVFKKQKERRPR